MYISTINFQQLKLLLASYSLACFFIVEYIFLKQFVKLLMVKYTYLLTFEIIIEIRENCRQITITFVTLNRFFSVKQTPSSPFVTDNIKMDGIIIQTSLHCGTSTKKCNQAITQATLWSRAHKKQLGICIVYIHYSELMPWLHRIGVNLWM